MAFEAYRLLFYHDNTKEEDISTLKNCEVGVHDINQLEIKLDYAFSPGERSSKYRLETYFFIPKSLGINTNTYQKEQFYRDIQTQLRYKPPTIAFEKLLDSSDGQSPLGQVIALLQTLQQASHNVETRQSLYQSLSEAWRFFACIFLGKVQDESRFLCTQLYSLKGSSAAHSKQYGQILSLFIQHISQTMAAFRSKAKIPGDMYVPETVKEVYQYVDEYLSLHLEAHVTSLLEPLQQLWHSSANKDLWQPIRDRLTTYLKQEQKNRYTWDHQTTYARPVGDESFLYRRGLLKKFVNSVLYLDSSREKEQRLADFVAGIAAGIAMLFATTAAVFTQSWTIFNSRSFVVALVAIYILKDRIKDWLKQYFAAKIGRWMWDYNVNIVDPRSKRTIGYCKEFFYYTYANQLPEGILQHRLMQAHTLLEKDLKREVVLRYEKDIYLNSKHLGQQNPTYQEITDIIRFNIAEFLGRTDDPIRHLTYYDANQDEIQNIACPKVYHLNLVFAFYSSHKNQPDIRRVRVILDKKGIKRVESL